MKNSLIVTALILGASAYIYQYHAPEAGWSSVFGECKHCSCAHKHAPQQVSQEVVTVAVAEEPVAECPIQQS